MPDNTDHMLGNLSSTREEIMADERVMVRLRRHRDGVGVDNTRDIGGAGCMCPECRDQRTRTINERFPAPVGYMEEWECYCALCRRHRSVLAAAYDVMAGVWEPTVSHTSTLSSGDQRETSIADLADALVAQSMRRSTIPIKGVKPVAKDWKANDWEA